MGHLTKAVCCVFALSFNASFAVENAYLKDRVLSAVGKVDSVEPDYSDQWAFTKTTNHNGEIIVETYNPKHEPGKRWVLVSVNQKTPEASRIEEYKKSMMERGQYVEKEKTEGKKWLAWLIDVNSLSLVSETADELRASFSPLIKNLDNDVQKKLKGELVISKDGNYVRSVEVTNKEPLSPNFSVKLNEFHTKCVFQKLADGQYGLQQSMNRVKGRVVLVKSIDEAVSEEYGNYALAGK